jgi:hypothetical protein
MVKLAAHVGLIAIAFIGACAPVLAQAPESGQSSSGAQDAVPQDDRSSPNGEHPNPLEDPRDRIYYPGDTERVKPLARKLVGNTLLDQKGWTKKKSGPVRCT